MKIADAAFVAAVSAVLMAVLPVFGACINESDTHDDDSHSRRRLSAMERSQWDSEARRDAFELMSSESRAGLSDRAEMTNALGGRRFEPWEMLAQGRFRLLFDAKKMYDEGTGDVTQTDLQKLAFGAAEL